MSSGGNYFPDNSIDTLGISDVLLVSTIVYVTGGLVRAPTAGLFFLSVQRFFFFYFGAPLGLDLSLTLNSELLNNISYWTTLIWLYIVLISTVLFPNICVSTLSRC